MARRVYVLVFALLVSVAAPAAASDAPRLRTAASAVAELAAEAAQRQHARESEPLPATRIDAPARVRSGRKIVNVPQLCRDSRGRYDLVVHFHGAPEMIEPVFQRAAIDAVFVVVNLGVGSGPYEDAFVQDGSLSSLLDDIDQIVAKACPHANGSRGRLALSSWSAGYGAIYRVLASKNDSQLVDAVLLADGLHAGFLDKFRQRLNEQQMAPFDAFAERAVRGEKLFGITHTSIVTPKYASTTETARYLIAKHDVPRQDLSEPGPRAAMKLLLRADRGELRVLGYGGQDTDAHCDHLYAMGDTLYPMLRARWAR